MTDLMTAIALATQAKPSTCFKCAGEKWNSGDGEIYQCGDCGARQAHGQQMPRIVVQKHGDERFVVVTIAMPPDHDHETAQQFVVDKVLAKMWGSALVTA